MGISTAAWVSAGIAAVGTAASISNSNKQRAQAQEAAEAQKIALGAEAQANAMAAQAAVRREQTAEQMKTAEEQATSQLDNTPDVAVNSETSSQRRRRVQASFGVGAGGAVQGSGSIRV